MSLLEDKRDGTSDLNIRTSTLSKNGKENARVRGNKIAANLRPAAKCLIDSQIASKFFKLD